mmetsp:Transcript_33634/g.73410  ORF Transcript_33634/g.73410 Transcript_33634/m.73410 type:complete len:409 (-) Transcript_33634:14312-15538(-)
MSMNSSRIGAHIIFLTLQDINVSAGGSVMYCCHYTMEQNHLLHHGWPGHLRRLLARHLRHLLAVHVHVACAGLTHEHGHQVVQELAVSVPAIEHHVLVEVALAHQGRGAVRAGEQRVLSQQCPLLGLYVELPELGQLLHHGLAAHAAHNVQRRLHARGEHLPGEAGGGDRLREDDGIRRVLHGALKVLHARAELGPLLLLKVELPDLVRETALALLRADVAAVHVHAVAAHRGAVAEARVHEVRGGHGHPRLGLEVVLPEVVAGRRGAAAVHVHGVLVHHCGVVVAAQLRRAVHRRLEGPLVRLELVLPHVRVLVGGALTAEDVHGVVVHHGGMRLASRGRAAAAHHLPLRLGVVVHELLLARVHLDVGVVGGDDDGVPQGNGARGVAGELGSADEHLADVGGHVVRS